MSASPPDLRDRRSPRAWGRLALAGVLLGLVGCAAPTPAMVTPTFVDRVATARPWPGPCAVRVVELTDARRSPGVLGVVTGRAVKGPEDPDAWLRSILQGLTSRGVAVAFEDAAASPSDALVARVSLRMAWLTETSTNKTANVVLHVRAERLGRPSIDRDYRGGLTTINWAGTENELQGLVNHAFAEALDDMATDFHRLCAP